MLTLQRLHLTSPRPVMTVPTRTAFQKLKMVFRNRENLGKHVKQHGKPDKQFPGQPQVLADRGYTGITAGI
jgi:hypothetical protein